MGEAITSGQRLTQPATGHSRAPHGQARRARQRGLPLRAALLLAIAGLLLAGCSAPAHPQPMPAAGKAAAGLRVPSLRPAGTSPSPSPSRSPSPSPSRVRPAVVPAFCAAGGARLWENLAACGWPGPGNTGPDLSQCPGGRLTPNSGPLTRTIPITTAGTVISCEDITGMLDIQAPGVTVRNSVIESNSGQTGEAANGTAAIKIEDGASATIEHVGINGDDGVHACIWHQGTSMVVNAVNCSGADDGIWSWADSSFSATTGDHFVIENSYFHGFTTRTSNGHEDGYQTEGASDGLIEHNTYLMTADADSAIAIWDSLRSSSGITVSGNLITGGGFAIYAEDYNPGDGGPGDPPAAGGFSDTGIRFAGNRFSTYASGCVGQFGVWFTRPWPPYDGGPTDGWHRDGNVVLETGRGIDSTNPTSNGQLCH